LSNRWHDVVRPETDGQVAKKMHVMRAIAPKWSQGDVTRSRRGLATLFHLFQRRDAGISTPCRAMCQAVKQGSVRCQSFP
jgi:hypothetical protein